MTASPSPAPITSRHVARGVGTTLLSRSGSVIEVVSQPLYVAMFGLASFGLYSVLWAAINLAENIFDLGMTSSMQRTVPQAKDDAAAAASLRQALILGVTPNLLIAMLASLFAPQIAPWLNVAQHDIPHVVPAIRLFAWALPLWAFVEIATSALRARHLFGAEIRLRLAYEQLMRLILAAILYCAGLGLTGLFIAHLVSLSATVLLSIRLLARHYRLDLFLAPAPEPLLTGNTMKAGISVLPANMVARFFGDLPPILLNMLLPGSSGASAAALYTIARKLSSLVQVVRTAFSYVLAPLASSALRRDFGDVRALYSYSTRLITVIVLPLVAALSAGIKPILQFFGHDAGIAYGACLILILARGLEAILGSASPVFQVVSAYRRQLLPSIVGVTVALLIGLLLVPLSPLSGMAAAVACGLLLASATPMALLHRYQHIHPFHEGFQRTAAIASAIAASAAVLAWTATLLPRGAALFAILIVALGAIWSACRFALAEADRLTLGKTGRALRLIA
ncbi:lipopolysaccharide biosynthesis protein [Flavisphingomonas formosensis]|uniref:lipopolysaccharide biosynthesis protein n=1 Tax=Flavisphingomonas formosensis TaxID=861534 RepID=UPI0012FCE9A0|nr:oligosaccharide flippase family protein [Sphingomonas formosensis]